MKESNVKSAAAVRNGSSVTGSTKPGLQNLKRPEHSGRLRFGRSMQRFAQNPLTIFGTVLIGLLLLTALIGPYLTPYNPLPPSYSERFLPPSIEHLLGTDHLGRDILARIMYGSRISLLIAVVVSGMSGLIGMLIGGIAGYFGGPFDEVIMRFTDIFLSFPWLLFAMSIAMVIGPNLWNSMIALAFIWWPGYARLVRAQVLSIKTNDYVEAARSLGAGNWRIFFRHVLPNTLGPYVVLLTLGAGRVILATSTLSFIGLGAQPPTPEWGVMVADGRTLLFDAWWIATFPGLAIVLTSVGFNLIGDGLRDLLDPRSTVR